MLTLCGFFYSGFAPCEEDVEKEDEGDNGFEFFDVKNDINVLERATFLVLCTTSS